MYEDQLTRLKKAHFLPAFIPLPDAIKIFTDSKKIPEISESFFLSLMREMDFHVFVCFIGWNWSISVHIDLINSTDYPKEQAEFFIEKAETLYNEVLNSSITSMINLYSKSGLFAEIYCLDRRMINDFVKSGLVRIDDTIFGIRNEHGRDLLEKNLPNLEKLININKEPNSGKLVIGEKVPDDGLAWGVTLSEVELTGYENQERNWPLLSESSTDNSVEVSKGDLFIARDDLLVLLELKEDSENTNPIKAQNTSEEPKEAIKNGVSERKRKAMTTASNIADSLWRMEQHKDTRITDMAYEVYSALHGIGFADQLPEKQESIASWIRTVAPEHARKAGRPPKTITPNLR